MIHAGLIGKNLLRNRRRSVLTALGVAVAIFVYAALLLGERLSPGQVLGGAAVLAGVFLVHRSRQGTQPN